MKLDHVNSFSDLKAGDAIYIRVNVEHISNDRTWIHVTTLPITLGQQYIGDILRVVPEPIEVVCSGECDNKGVEGLCDDRLGQLAEHLDSVKRGMALDD